MYLRIPFPQMGYKMRKKCVKNEVKKYKIQDKIS